MGRLNVCRLSPSAAGATPYVLSILLSACASESIAPVAAGNSAESPSATTVASAGTNDAPTTVAPQAPNAQPVAAPPDTRNATGEMMVPGEPEAPTAATTAESPPPSGSATYHRDIRPIAESRCVGCHVEGGSGPFPLTTYAEVSGLGGLVVAAVAERRMPPWLADDTDCTPIIDDQRLTDEQLALFADWEQAGFPEGNEADFAPPAAPVQRQIGEPNMIIKATRPFQLTGGIEDYFCLQTDAQFDEDTWVTAMDLIPENDQYLHHAIVNVGRACSALGTVAENIYSYRPGSRTLIFEEGDAMKVPAGSNIMIQFHYNTRFEPRTASLPTDHSQLRFWTLPAGEQPVRDVTRMAIHDLSISIPVGAVDKREGNTQSFGRTYGRAGAEIIGVSPHMHYLGKRFEQTLQQGGESSCLVNIPAWDQDWQLDYFFEPENYIPVSSSARVVQDCYYNNRPEDQGRDPEGNLFTPRYTTFGEDTRQEMCLGYVWVRYPL